MHLSNGGTTDGVFFKISEDVVHGVSLFVQFIVDDLTDVGHGAWRNVVEEGLKEIDVCFGDDAHHVGCNLLSIFVVETTQFHEYVEHWWRVFVVQNLKLSFLFGFGEERKEGREVLRPDFKFGFEVLVFQDGWDCYFVVGENAVDGIWGKGGEGGQREERRAKVSSELLVGRAVQ